MKQNYIILIILFISIIINIRQWDSNKHNSILVTALTKNISLQKSIDEIKEKIYPSNKRQEEKYKQIKNDNYVQISNESVDTMLYWYNNFSPNR